MPFTISHAAAVLPFSRLLARWQLLSAVVIGAMVPDFGLFFPWRIQRFETHSVWGVFAFCLPVGLVAYGLRRGREQPVRERPLRAAERRAWVLTYVVAAVALSVAWWLREPAVHSLAAMANGMAVSALRGLAMGLLCISLSLDWRLRALRVSSPRTSR